MENDPDIAGLAAVAFDGEYYYMVGHPTEAQNLSEDGDRRRMAVEITHLPIPDAAAAKRGSAGAGWWSRVNAKDASRAEGRDGKSGRGVFGRLFGYLQEEWRMAAEAATGKEPAPAEEAAEPPVRDTKHAVRVLFYKLFYQKLPPDLGVRQVRMESGGAPVYSKVTSQDVSKARRALLITHGFGSSTEKLVQRALPHLKELDEYDLALTFDYETINTGIRESGLLMTTQLRRLGFGTDSGPPLDIFSHSMGTQVARVCVEMESGHQFVERVIMVGAHNTGTALAESHRLIPWLGTIILNQAGLMDFERLAQRLVIGISRLTTGIQDLAPSAELYQKLNDPRNEVDVRYYIQIGINTEMDGPINWRKLFSKTSSRPWNRPSSVGPNCLSASKPDASHQKETKTGCRRLLELPAQPFE